MNDEPFRIGFLLFPNLTQLDLTGPYEVLSKLRNAEMHLIWKNVDPVRSDCGLSILPTTTFADCPDMDLICVPGGVGIAPLLTDGDVLEFLQCQSQTARYITSVCTGALVLGAAGLLKGRRAATHWTAMEFLSAFGAIATDSRVVVDGNVITGAGVTAGIDFGLHIVAEIAGDEAARLVQLAIEYDPNPPFASGHPRVADPALVDRLRTALAPRQAARRLHVEKAAAAL